MKECIDQEGYFSPLVTDLIKSEPSIKGNMSKKISKAYRKNVLNQLLFPILLELKIDVDQL